MLIKLEDCKEFIAGDHTLIREIVNPSKGVKIGYSFSWFRVLAGKRSSKHSLKSSEVYFIISGKGKMHLDTQEFNFKENDTIYIPLAQSNLLKICQKPRI